MMTLQLFSDADSPPITLGPAMRFHLDGAKLTPGLAPDQEIVHHKGHWRCRGRQFTTLESDVPVLLFVGQTTEPLGPFRKLSMVDGSFWHEKETGKILLGRLDENEGSWHFPQHGITSRVISLEASP